MFHVVEQAINEKCWQQLVEGIIQVEDREEVETIEKNEKIEGALESKKN